MARWDTIFSLPIQSPPTFEFSSADLEWTTVEGWSDKMEKVAFIPFDRVDNFLSGESANKDFPTRFYKEAGRKSKSSSSSKEKVDGVLEFTMYRCVFGPDDRREGGTIRPSRNTYVCKKKTAGRPSIKRGCQCYFFVKRLVAKPMAALIIYKQDKHVDKEGLPCHGPQDARSVGTRAGSAPYIIDELLVLLSSLIHIGFSVETIMHIRNEMIEKKQGPFHCDDLVTHRFARRLERNIRRSSYDLDEDDAVSIEMWSSKHENDVFFCEDYSDSQPFVLGIQTEWQLQQMIKYGDNSIMASDSKFGTNKLQYPVHSVLVFDADKKAIPVAWIIAPQSANGDAYKWIRALHRRVRSKKPDWKLAGFVIDDPSADINTIREVFQCSVLISFWRVRHAWHKNLVTKCVDIGMRSEMLGRLGKAVYDICEGNGDVTLFENFMEDFVDCPDFVDYFRAVWFPRLGMWVAALKSLPYASEENCSAMELYHDKLKVVLSDEKNTNVYQRTDWLVDKLFTKVHSCFFLESYQCKEHFAPYTKAKWTTGSTSWGRSSEIPDSDVILENNRSAKVISQQCREKTYVVLNPGSEFSLCDCSWSEKGNLCKHMIKVSRMCRRQQSSSPSISLFKYNQALMKLLHFAPRDSLVRDHAVSLTVNVQEALKKHGIVDRVIEREHFEQLATPVESASGIQDEARGSNDVNGTKVVDQAESDSNLCGENAVHMSSCSDDMDVDPVSMCLSPSELPSEGIFSSLRKEDGSIFGNTESFSSNNDSFIIGDRIQDYISDREFRAEMISKGVCMDVLEGSLAGSMMDIDPQPIQQPIQRPLFRCEIH